MNMTNAISNWKDISKRLGARKNINMFSDIFSSSKPFVRDIVNKKTIKLK